MSLQTAPNTLDQLGRLNPEFVEYMMGLPVGWVTDSGLARTQQLKMLGNGVVPQQAKYALELLTSTKWEDINED
jgi:DNA (cytosine-5)-methyltransferase 1